MNTKEQLQNKLMNIKSGFKRSRRTLGL